ncbi:MAG: hypothetical protein AUH89_04005 [Ktedonobacter sp. 13_1_40CM_4_52_4]|nr:MAG: hypothetical protein AUH89_04005 [Ktedonobacter sp. 13_1_40CM_4_52_4]
MLNLAVETFERQLKRIARIHSDFTHKRLPARLAVARTTGALCLVTIAAVYRFVTAWLERHLSLVATTGTRYSIHLTWFAVSITATTTVATTTIPATLSFACGSARWTAARRIGQPAAGIEFLLTYGKNELLIAIATIQRLIC